MNESAISQPVVVGIDGSKAAIHAALWAVDEAASRDVPLRLLCAIEQDDNRATAETAIRHAVKAVEAAGKPVKIEAEVPHGPAIGSLVRASASAVMVCLGAVGLRHFQPSRVGSTAAALALSARCPVALIRLGDDHPHLPAERILVEADESPGNGVVLDAAIEEARLRNAPLQVIICRRNASGDDRVTDTEGNRRALADLDRRLARWKRHHPDLRVESAAVHGGLLAYLAHHRRSARLVVVGTHNHDHLSELVGAAGSAILQKADCSLFIVNQQHL